MKSNEIRKIAKCLTADYYSSKQQMELKSLFNKQIPHNGFGEFIKEYFFNKKPDMVTLVYLMRKHMPELKKELDEIENS